LISYNSDSGAHSFSLHLLRIPFLFLLPPFFCGFLSEESSSFTAHMGDMGPTIDFLLIDPVLFSIPVIIPHPPRSVGRIFIIGCVPTDGLFFTKTPFRPFPFYSLALRSTATHRVPDPFFPGELLFPGPTLPFLSDKLVSGPLPLRPGPPGCGKDLHSGERYASRLCFFNVCPVTFWCVGFPEMSLVQTVFK